MQLASYIASHDGMGLIAYQASAQKDIVVLPLVRTMTASELSDMIGVIDGRVVSDAVTIEMQAGKEDVVASMDAQTAVMAKLLAVSDETFGASHDCLFQAIMTRGRNRRYEACQIVPTYDMGHGWHRRGHFPSDFGTPLVSVDAFAVACSKAVHDGRIAIANKSGREYCNHLSTMRLVVTVGGLAADLRLDIALALLKRGTKLPYDAYGERMLGAMVRRNNATGRLSWKLVYKVQDTGKVREPDLANIDHVFPQARGGRTRLCNLQVMHTRLNSHKSDGLMPDVNGEPMTSLAVLKMLDDGVRNAHANGDIDDAMFHAWNELYDDEAHACWQDMMVRSVCENAVDIIGVVNAFAK